MNKRKYCIYRVPCTWNSVTFVIKHYSDGHYYLNEEVYVSHSYKPYNRLFYKRFVRTSKRRIKEMLNYE